eukprot:jgi/Mesvir1/21682/Mv04103-RA.1
MEPEDSASYREELRIAQEEDLSSEEELGFCSIAGNDLEGRPMVVIKGRQLPVTVMDMQKIRRFIIRTLDDVVRDEYSLVYFHTDVTRAENSPGVLWLIQTFQFLPRRYKKNLKALFVVHPALQLRTLMAALAPWLSDKFWSKVVYIPRVEFLWDYCASSALEVPEYVAEHDKELEASPLMDYGIIGDIEVLKAYGAHV